MLPGSISKLSEIFVAVEQMPFRQPEKMKFTFKNLS